MAGQREGGFTFDLGSPTPGAVQGEGDGSFDPSPSAPLGSDSDVGHLDLDLGDLGVALRAGKTPAPASAASRATEETKRSGGAEALSGAPAPQRLFRRETRLGSTPWGAFSRKPEDSSSGAAKGSDEPVRAAATQAAHESLGDAAIALEVAQPAPLATTAAEPTGAERSAAIAAQTNALDTAMIEARGAAEHELAALERAHGAAERELAPATKSDLAATDEARGDTSRDEVPRVKKIVFPAPAPTTSAARAPEETEAPAPFEPPLDLPDELRARSPALPEPPSPQALWRLTRDLWRSTTRQAASLGRASAARGLSLAEEAKGVWRRKRSARSADPAISRAPLPGDSARSTAAASSAARAVPLSAADAASLSTARTTSSSESVKAVAAHQATVSSTPERPRGPSPSGFGRRLLRQLAPPAATVSVAALVYVAGSHVLGVTDAVSLSRTTSVPHLGSLPSAEVNTTTSGSPAERKAVPATGSDETAPTPRGPHVEKAPFPADLSYPGKGLIEVVTREDELIYVNGVFIGRGPLRRVPVNPGEHAVSIRSGGSEQKSDLRVESNATTRVSFVPAPSSSE